MGCAMMSALFVLELLQSNLTSRTGGRENHALVQGEQGK